MWKLLVHGTQLAKVELGYEPGNWQQIDLSSGPVRGETDSEGQAHRSCLHPQVWAVPRDPHPQEVPSE